MAKKSPSIFDKTSVKKVTNYELTITRSMFIEMLLKEGVVLPDNVDITVYIPGGGDWANTELDIVDDVDRDGGSVIKISYKEET